MSNTDLGLLAVTSFHVFPKHTCKGRGGKFQLEFLSKQFKKNQKIINCPNDNISQAIEEDTTILLSMVLVNLLQL